MFSKKATKSSPSIWHYVENVKTTVKLSSIFVTFLENMNFTKILFFIHFLENALKNTLVF